ncbi:MAG: cupredoxin domain-containing protein [Solirubrobacterales bacterium]|nr:cupredoxin domain-containing protein [Solirubrobacterales bacterium]
MRKVIAVTLTAAVSATAAVPALALGSKSVKVKTKSAKVESYFFSPAKLTISRGTRVVWHFVNTGGVEHTVTVKNGPVHFSSREMASGTYSHTFTKAGTYHLYCIVHPIMTETVVVR